MKKCYLILFFFFILSTLSFAQKNFSTLDVAGPVTGIRGMMVGTDIFLSIDSKGNRSYMIHPDGTKTELDIRAIQDKLLIGAAQSNDKTFFYYLEAKGKTYFISALEFEGQSKTGMSSSQGIELPGKIYGSYIEDDGSIFLLCSLKKELTLTLLQIREMKEVNRTNFPLSFDLGKSKGEDVSFYRGDIPTTPKQAAAKIKLVKEQDAIWITVDEPANPYESDPVGSKVFRTTVIKLDLMTGKSSIKGFFETSILPFTSTMLNGNLYRLIQADNGYRIDQFNFSSGKKLHTVALPYGKEVRQDSLYARIKSKVKKDIRGAAMLNRVFGQFLIVDSLSSNEILFTIGDYGDMMMAPIAGIPNVAGLVIAFSSLIVRDIAEGPFSCVYHYCVGSMDKGIKHTYATPLLRQAVDDYEYNLMKKKVKLDYKGYVYKPNAIFAIYQKEKAGGVDILKFEN